MKESKAKAQTRAPQVEPPRPPAKLHHPQNHGVECWHLNLEKAMLCQVTFGPIGPTDVFLPQSDTIISPLICRHVEACRKLHPPPPQENTASVTTVTHKHRIWSKIGAVSTEAANIAPETTEHIEARWMVQPCLLHWCVFTLVPRTQRNSFTAPASQLVTLPRLCVWK